MSNAVEIKQLNVHYKNSGFSLDDVTINIPKGYIVGLIGENGAGKTTIINSILGLQKQYTGIVEIFGETMDLDNTELKEKIGVCFDEIYLPKNLKIKQVEDIYRKFYPQWDSKFFNQTLDFFNISQDKKIEECSQGMQKMFSIVLSMSHQPDFLVLDEPTSSLDPVKRQDVLEIFQTYIAEDEKRSILFSSHITTDIEQIADIVIFLKAGHVVFCEPITTLLYDYGMCHCTKEQFDQLHQTSMIAYKKETYGYSVLLNRKQIDNELPDHIEVEKPNLEFIMNLYAKGVIV